MQFGQRKPSPETKQSCECYSWSDRSPMTRAITATLAFASPMVQHACAKDSARMSRTIWGAIASRVRPEFPGQSREELLGISPCLEFPGMNQGKGRTAIEGHVDGYFLLRLGLWIDKNKSSSRKGQGLYATRISYLPDFKPAKENSPFSLVSCTATSFSPCATVTFAFAIRSPLGKKTTPQMR